MAILPITVYGDQILRKKLKPITKVDSKLIQLIKDMFETLQNADGIGLTANQVNEDKSLFVVDISPVKGYEHFKPYIFINPKIEYYSEEKINMEEGCLSLPDIRVEVERAKNIRIAYQDIELRNQILEAEDLFARVIQHEYDHTQGIFITDKVNDEKKKMLKRDLQRIKNRKVDIDYPITKKVV
ncbi:MAG: peptide deformylase [Ignavibacterium sp.]